MSSKIASSSLPPPRDEPKHPNPQQQHRGGFGDRGCGVQEIVGGKGGVGDSDFVDESLVGSIVVVGVAADGEAGAECGVQRGEGAYIGEDGIDE